jgi:hypothetical protein
VSDSVSVALDHETIWKTSFGVVDTACDLLVFKMKLDAVNPTIRNLTTSPPRISMRDVNDMCVVAGSPALGKSYEITGVALKEPTAAVTVKDLGLTGPDAAFVEIL